MTEKDSSAIVLHLQAQSFEGMGELLPAAGCYYNIQAKYPDDYLAASKLGALNISGSYFDEAIEATEKYRQIDSTNISVNRQNALAYCLKQDYPTAIQRYEYLVSQGDSSFHTCYYLGISYYAAEKYYEAHDFLKVESYCYLWEWIDQWLFPDSLRPLFSRKFWNRRDRGNKGD